MMIATWSKLIEKNAFIYVSVHLSFIFYIQCVSVWISF